MSDWKVLAEEAWNAPSWKEAAQQHDRSKSGSEGADIVRARRLLADSVSLDCACRELSDTRNRPTPKATVDALVYCVRQRGLVALEEPANVDRLSRCDADSRQQLNSRIEKLEISK
jgi:hypothetical protein